MCIDAVDYIMQLGFSFVGLSSELSSSVRGRLPLSYSDLHNMHPTGCKKNLSISVPAYVMIIGYGSEILRMVIISNVS